MKAMMMALLAGLFYASAMQAQDNIGAFTTGAGRAPKKQSPMAGALDAGRAAPLASDSITFKPLPPALPAPPSGPTMEASVKQWQAAAVAKYLALADKSSRFNQLFVGWYKEKQSSEPKFFATPDWPMRLADEVAKIKYDEDARIGAFNEAAKLAVDGYTVTVAGRFGAATKEMFDKAEGLIADHDQAALQQMEAAGLIVAFEGGQVVKVVDSTLFPPRLKIRAKGSLTEVWTAYDGVADPGGQCPATLSARPTPQK